MDQENIIIILLDSCRYDAFESANAKNMKSLGKLHKCYSPGNGTLPSMAEFMS